MDSTNQTNFDRSCSARVTHARRSHADSSNAVNTSNTTSQRNMTLSNFAAWRPKPLSTPWRSFPCAYCGALLLQNEPAPWCCRNGSKAYERLPPMPPRIQALMDNPADQHLLSTYSRSQQFILFHRYGCHWRMDTLFWWSILASPSRSNFLYPLMLLTVSGLHFGATVSVHHSKKRHRAYCF